MWEDGVSECLIFSWYRDTYHGKGTQEEGQDGGGEVCDLHRGGLRRREVVALREVEYCYNGVSVVMEVDEARQSRCGNG